MADVTARKRPNATTWEYRIELASVNGKRKQKSKGGFRTKSEALKAGRQALELYENGGTTTSQEKLGDVSVSDLLDTWLSEYSKTTLKQVTAEGYEKKIRLYIKPAIGHYKVKSVTRQMLQKLISDLSDEGFSKNTVSGVRGILTTCFDWAEMNQYIVNTPAYNLKIPVNTEKPSRTDNHIYISQEQISSIFERFPEGSTPYIPMKIAYYTGLRLGEVFGLTWDDIDLDNKILTVNRQVQWQSDKSMTKEEKEKNNGSKNCGNGCWYFSSPKYFSYRTITIPKDLIAILEKEHKKQKKAAAYYEEYYRRYYTVNDFKEKNGLREIYKIPIQENKTNIEVNFVCRREDGSYATPRIMQYTSNVIHKKLGIIDFDFHSFRHTHATMLLEKHVPLIYIQNRLGHVKIDTTNVYTNHLTDELKAQGDAFINTF